MANLAVSKGAHKLPNEDQKGFGGGGGDFVFVGVIGLSGVLKMVPKMLAQFVSNIWRSR